MILGFITIVVMGIVAYAFWREGPLTAFAACVNVLISGLLAFSFWEPIADVLDPAFNETFAAGIEDGVSMMIVFVPSLMLLRWATNSLASTNLEYPPILFRAGGVAGGLLAGYLLSGFLVCVIQTLPLARDFMTFEPYEPGKSPVLRKVLPPDTVWLAMMHRLSGAGLSGGDDRFDAHSNFELRYSRFRRFYFDDKGEQKVDPYRGELDP
jgi:Colicin V production protein